ncbi:MAG: hypothetical protein ACRDKI_11780, partial [Solirubrobacterales bacterium]
MGMTDRDKKLLAIFAAVVFLGGYWFLVLGKKRAAVTDAEQAKASAQQQLDAAKASETQGQTAKKTYPVKYSRVLRMGKAIPVDDDLASLLVQVNDISADAGVNFTNLAITDGAAATSAPGGPTGQTTCDVTVNGGGASSTTGPSGATSAVVTPAPAQSGVGQQINKAKAGEETASNDANRAAGANADIATKCASAPTLTDLTAVSSGLRLFTYNFTFQGSFYSLHNVFDGLLGMVKGHDGRIQVTGRLLQINNFNLSVKHFPTLEATVEMTGYALPVGT